VLSFIRFAWVVKKLWTFWITTTYWDVEATTTAHTYFLLRKTDKLKAAFGGTVQNLVRQKSNLEIFPNVDNSSQTPAVSPITKRSVFFLNLKENIPKLLQKMQIYIVEFRQGGCFNTACLYCSFLQCHHAALCSHQSYITIIHLHIINPFNTSDDYYGKPNVALFNTYFCMQYKQFCV